jgi:hypothetical protein
MRPDRNGFFGGVQNTPVRSVWTRGSPVGSPVDYSDCVLGSENRQWGPVAPFGSKPCPGTPGPEIHLKIDNFENYNIHSS